MCYVISIMLFIVTTLLSVKGTSFEILDLDTNMIGAEGAKAALTHKYSAAWNTRVLVRTYPEVAADVRASDAEMAAAAEIFLKLA